MEISYLREFVHLAEVGNYLVAADDLFISQSSLSKHIKSIEQELGITLFDRTTRKVTLTDEGLIFLEYAKKICVIQNEYKKEIDKLLSNKNSKVVIGVIPTMAQYDITDIVYNFQKKNKSMQLSLVMGDTLELEEKLLEESIDVAFMRKASNEEQFEKIDYYKDYLVAVVPITNPLSNYDSLTLDQVKEEEVCLLAKNTMLYNLVLKECEKYNFKPKIFYEGHHLTNIANFVNKGITIAILANRQTRFIRNPSVKIIPITPKVYSDVNLYYLKEKPITPAIQEIIGITISFLQEKKQKK